MDTALMVEYSKELKKLRSRVDSASVTFQVNFLESWTRLLEALSCLHYVTTFIFVGHVSLAIIVYLLFTDFYWVSLIYIAWLAYDWNTPCRGSRLWMWVRRWEIWKRGRDYFPVNLVKTAELDPAKNYLMGCHPHGVLVFGGFFNFATDATGLSTVFPGMKVFLMTLHQMFKMPVFRDYFMLSGSTSVRKDSIEWLLSQNGVGNVGVVVVGGAQEALDAHPGVHRLSIQARKGFVKLALVHGADLVPAYTFGENNAYDQIANAPGTRLRRFQNFMTQICGFSPPLFYGRGFSILPYRTPITTVVGQPITVEKTPNPSRDQVESMHALYLKKLTELFETHKTKHGVSPEQRLEIV
ncbi:2-acylglycerol O-acyltransferase 2-like [Patiria miniata]|uniref:Acyltransferase n=1 Tax=Patiria miniata TaxID=46514 RepID=A0A913ZER9_PATMI|nr:2-acylglycerol O-acyltransferase 2-like [Patiria miniata]XP_038050282.1 2-acylglycerol O-acyltransferase 2-like [Patiria miniata]XP_038050283.1 2-acylglycerol O-acyltransferase 2-like [Patiria miniata]